MNKAYDKKRQTITIFITIFLFWLLLSGLYTPFMILLGIISSLGITLIITKMNIIEQGNSIQNLRIDQLLKYSIWLIREIIVSNLKVCLIIINPSHKVEPEIIEIEALDVSKITNTLYANSITLTPGTLTLDVDKNKMKIHTLDVVFKQSLLTQEMAKKVDAIDGRLSDRS